MDARKGSASGDCREPEAERTHGDLVVVCKMAVRYRDSPPRASGERPNQLKQELVKLLSAGILCIFIGGGLVCA